MTKSSSCLSELNLINKTHTHTRGTFDWNSKFNWTTDRNSYIPGRVCRLRKLKLKLPCPCENAAILAPIVVVKHHGYWIQTNYFEVTHHVCIDNLSITLPLSLSLSFSVCATRWEWKMTFCSALFNYDCSTSSSSAHQTHVDCPNKYNYQNTERERKRAWQRRKKIWKDNRNRKCLFPIGLIRSRHDTNLWYQMTCFIAMFFIKELFFQIWNRCSINVWFHFYVNHSIVSSWS